MSLSPEAQAKMDEAADEIWAELIKGEEIKHVKTIHRDGFRQGYAFARDGERERATLILRRIKEEHPDCECEVYDSEAAVICVSCIIEPYLKESDS